MDEQPKAESLPWAPEELRRALELAFAESVPSYYGNIFYVTTTDGDVRIAFGTTRPSTSDAAARYAIEKFDVSIYMPVTTARRLVDVLNQFLAKIA